MRTLPPQLQGEDDEEGGSGGGEPACSSDAPKFLVFAHHKTVMNRLAAALEGATGYAPVGYVRIDGSTDPEDRWMGRRVGAGRAGLVARFWHAQPDFTLHAPSMRALLCMFVDPAAGAWRCGASAPTHPSAWRCCR